MDFRKILSYLLNVSVFVVLCGEHGRLISLARLGICFLFFPHMFKDLFVPFHHV